MVHGTEPRLAAEQIRTAQTIAEEAGPSLSLPAQILKHGRGGAGVAEDDFLAGVEALDLADLVPGLAGGLRGGSSPVPVLGTAGWSASSAPTRTAPRIPEAIRAPLITAGSSTSRPPPVDRPHRIRDIWFRVSRSAQPQRCGSPIRSVSLSLPFQERLMASYDVSSATVTGGAERAFGCRGHRRRACQSMFARLPRAGLLRQMRRGPGRSTGDRAGAVAGRPGCSTSSAPRTKPRLLRTATRSHGRNRHRRARRCVRVLPRSIRARTVEPGHHDPPLQALRRHGGHPQPAEGNPALLRHPAPRTPAGASGFSESRCVPPGTGPPSRPATCAWISATRHTWSSS